MNGVVSAYALKSIYGKKQYFDSNGNLIQISDKYNNTIQFKYSNVSPYGTVLTSISDIIGNVINISYSTSQVVLTMGNKTVTYSKTMRNGKEFLADVKDPMERKTTYSYDIGTAKFNLLGTTPITDNHYALLTGVTHPTGAKTTYEYEPLPVKREIASGMVNEAFRLKLRKDTITFSDSSTKDYNISSLSYTGDIGSSFSGNTTFSTTITNGTPSMTFADGVLATTFNFKKTFINNDTGSAYYQTQSMSDDGAIQQFTQYTYDEVKRRTDPLSVSTYNRNKTTLAVSPTVTQSQTYDDYRNVLTSNNAAGAISTFNYNATTHLLDNATVDLSLTKKQYTTYTRNTLGDVTESVVRDNNATGALRQQVQFGYDGFGNVTWVRNMNNSGDAVTTIEYNQAHGYAFPTKITNSYIDADGVTKSQSVQGVYDISSGSLTSFIDGKTKTTSYGYDKLGRLTLVTHPDNKTIQWQYNDVLNQVTNINETGRTTIQKFNSLGWTVESGIMDAIYKAKSKTGYDKWGRVEWSEDARGKKTTFGYDNRGRVTKTTNADLSYSAVVYDDINQTSTTTSGEKDGATSSSNGGKKETVSIRSTFDKLGRTIKEEQITKSNTVIKLGEYTYDYTKNVIQSVDGKNKVTSYEYDVMGRLTSVKNPLQEKTSYTYDLLGNLTFVTNPDQTYVQKEYDELGRLIRQKDAMGQTTKYFYDANGNMVRQVDRKGMSIVFNYSDNRNFLMSKVSPSETISYEYYDDGSRKKMVDQTGETSYLYENGTGLLKSVTYPDSKTVQYEYDPNGSPEKITDPFNNEYVYKYNDVNLLENVKIAGMIEAEYTYYTNGLLRTSSLSSGNIVSTYGYDGTRLMTLIQNSGNGAHITNYSYTYDENSNIKTNAKVVQGVPGATTSATFGYDDLNRIQTATPNNEVYKYDDRGNRVSMEGDNLTLPKSSQMVYDDWNRLKQVTTNDGKVVNYKYNGDGILYERQDVNGTTRYYYNGDQVIAEGTVTGTSVMQKAAYTRGIGLINVTDGSGNKAYYLMNGHGDVTELRSGTGALLNEYQYDIWGNTLQATGTVYNSFRYSGEMWDNTTELQNLRARWYDPSIGRFINEDSYEGQIDNPLTLNLYTYVNNNPLSNVDPSGNAAVPINSNGKIGFDTETGKKTTKAIKDFCTWFGCDEILQGLSFMGPEFAWMSGMKAFSAAEEIAETTLKYTATSGVKIVATAGKTTTILGRYGDDMQYIISELKLEKSWNFEGKSGGFNILNVPNEIFEKLTENQFWDLVNKPFLDKAITRGDVILMATKPTVDKLSVALHKR